MNNSTPTTATSWLILLLYIILPCILQVFLSRRIAKWPGLILPIITFLYSLLIQLAIVPTSDWKSTVFLVLYAFFIANIPTAVFLAIYFACRKKMRQKKDLEKMEIQDL